MHEDKGNLALRIKADNVSRLVRQIENKWKSIVPGQPFEHSFMDDDFNEQYKAEQRTGGISLTFSLLAICIVCLGLFGLAAYAAEQRTKEIGIRKVLAAALAVGIALATISWQALKAAWANPVRSLRSE